MTMSEKDNLQDADGKDILKKEANTMEEKGAEVQNLPNEELPADDVETLKSEDDHKSSEETSSKDAKIEAAENTSAPIMSETALETEQATSETATLKKKDAFVEEIEESNAEDAEDDSNVERHNLEDKDYHSMSMEQLADEFEGLLKNKNIQTIKSPVEEIRTEFNSKFSETLEQKKDDFLSEGGN